MEPKTSLKIIEEKNYLYCLELINFLASLFEREVFKLAVWGKKTK